jgi:hypothetical protein
MVAYAAGKLGAMTVRPSCCSWYMLAFSLAVHKYHAAKIRRGGEMPRSIMTFHDQTEALGTPLKSET